MTQRRHKYSKTSNVTYLSQDGVEESVEVFSKTAQSVANTAKQTFGDLQVAGVLLRGFRQHWPQLNTQTATPSNRTVLGKQGSRDSYSSSPLNLRNYTFISPLFYKDSFQFITLVLAQLHGSGGP